MNVTKLSKLMEAIAKREEAEGGSWDFGPARLWVLMYIAENNRKGVTATDVMNYLEPRLQKAQSTVSRGIAALGQGTAKKPGMGFITHEQNPADYRSKILKLSPKGLAFINELNDIMGGES